MARAPITYGDFNDWQRTYFHASKVSFPHAGMMVFASTISRFSDDTGEDPIASPEYRNVPNASALSNIGMRRAENSNDRNASLP